MIKLKLFGKLASVRNGIWTFQDPEDRVLLDTALALNFDTFVYHPNLDLAQVDALVKTWGDQVVILSASEPHERDTPGVIY